MAQSYLFRVLRSLDRLGNALTGGDDEETFSHRSARAWKKGKWWGRRSCWWLDKWKYIFGHHAWEDHCNKVLERPNPSDSTIPIDAPLKGDANFEEIYHDPRFYTSTK